MIRLQKSLRIPGFTHRFVLSGLNLERFLNLLLKDGVPLLAAERTDRRTLVCRCYSSDLAAIEALAQERGWRIESLEAQGLSSVFRFLRSRMGIPVGMILCLITALILSQYVWRIDLNGAAAYRAEIASYLSESGYRPGIRRSAVDARALETALTYRYPEIAWFHVYVSGVRMVIDVSPGVPQPELPSGIPGDVCASQAGIITSIQVYAGTPKVQPGDVVHRGQVLIEGVERAADETVTAVQARGMVMARCWDRHTVQMPLSEIISEETGRESVFWRIRTPLGCYPEMMETPDFLSFNTYVEEYPVAGAFFPVICQRITQREVSLQYAPRNPEEVRTEAAEAALKNLKERHFGDEIIDKWVDYCMIEDGSLAASVTVEWLMDIGGTSVP